MTKDIFKRLSIALALTFSMSAQAAVVRGAVVDSNGEPLIDASVRLLTLPDSTAVKGVVTNDSGRFSINNVKSGKYVLKVAYVGYNTLLKNVTVGNDDLRVGRLTMSETSYALKEATVSARRTEIKVSEDTVEFNADSYHTQPNAVVEDLLKRLPGVEVSNEGKITANGKEVSKILLDGKEFFADDPKVASKNLPANMIDKLQVVDRKSDLARLTGVDDGEDETVINLTVKKGMNNGWFGTIKGGYGTDKRYDTSFNVNRFWNGNQITFIGGANNINELGFTDSNGGRFRRFGGNNGIDTSQAFGVNFNVGKEEIIRVGGDVMYSHNDRKTVQRQNRQYLFDDSTSFLNSDKNARDRGHNLRADFRVQWNPDSFNVFDFQPSFSFNANNSESREYSETLAGDKARSLVTRSLNLNDSKGKSYELGGRLIYSHKFRNHPGRSFSVHANYRFSDVNEDDNTISYNRFFRITDSDEDYAQYTDNHTWSNSINSRLTWTEPLGNVKNGRFLTIAYSINRRWNNADKMVYDRGFLDPEGEDYPPVDYSTLTLNDELTNRYRNTFTTQRYQIGFKQVRKSYTIDLGVAAVPSSSKSENLTNAEKSLSTSTFNISPYLRYRYKLGRSTNLNIDYRSRSSQPSISQLQPVEDKSDPLRIVVGNPNLKPTFTHSVRARFSDFNMNSQRSIMAFLDGNYAQNSIVSKTTYDSETGGQRTTYVNENGIFNLMGACMVSFPLKNRNWQFTNHFFGRYSSTVGYNNANRNRTNTVNLNFGPGIAFRPDNFQFEFRPTYSLQATKSELKLNGNSTVHTYGAMLNASYYTGFGLSIDTDLRFSGSHGYTSGYNTNQWMWNASVSQQLLRDKSLTVALKVYDLLQQNKNIQRSVTANYIDDTEYNSLTRYFMLTISYRFNTFGKGNEPELRNDGPGRFGGPGGPPRGRGSMGGPPPGGGRRF